MLLCSGDKVLFGFYSLGIILLLVGGCLWGKGEDERIKSTEIVGKVLFAIGTASFVIGIVLNVYKRNIHRCKKPRSIQTKPSSNNLNIQTKPIIINNENSNKNHEKLSNFIDNTALNYQPNYNKPIDEVVNSHDVHNNNTNNNTHLPSYKPHSMKKVIKSSNYDFDSPIYENIKPLPNHNYSYSNQAYQHQLVSFDQNTQHNTQYNHSTTPSNNPTAYINAANNYTASLHSYYMKKYGKK